MAKQQRSDDESAALVRGFPAGINHQGLGVSQYGTLDLSPLSDYPLSFDFNHTDQSPATPPAFATPRDWYDSSVWFVDYNISNRASNRVFGINPWLPVAVTDGSSSFDEQLSHSLSEIDAFGHSPTPALTHGSSPDGEIPQYTGPVAIAASIEGNVPRRQRPPSLQEFVCDVCSVHVRGVRSRERHMREVHGDKGYQCRCGHRCSRKSNYIRHLNSCKLRRGLRDAQQAHFVCQCGEQQTEVGAHTAHIADCGRQRVGRPARGGR